MKPGARAPQPYEAHAGFIQQIVHRVTTTLDDANFEDQVWFNRIITELLEKLCPNVEPPEDELERQAFKFCLDIASINSIKQVKIIDDPPWLERHWDGILLESVSNRPLDTIDAMGQVYGRAGKAALALSYDAELFSWAEENLKVRLGERMKMTYIYYSNAGQKCRIHLDNPRFYEFNCLIGLTWTGNGNKTSKLRLFNNSNDISDVELCEKRAVVFDSSHTPHGRTALAEGEQVSILSLGFNRL